jgi:hypothetical protein
MTDGFIEFDDKGNAVVECWQCGGNGKIAGCFEDTCCCTGDPEDPDECCAPSRCDICRGKGRYTVSPERTEKGNG